MAIGGSAGVSDKGVKFMTSVGGVPPKPISASTVDLRDPRTRVGFQATPIIAGFTDQLEMYKVSLLRNIFWLSLHIRIWFQIVKAAKKNNIEDDHDESTDTSKCKDGTNLRNISQVDLTGTSITVAGLEQLLKSFCASLTLLKLDNHLWSALFKGIQSESICFDCVGGPCTSIRSVNCTENVAEHLEAMYDLFPSLEHISVKTFLFAMCCCTS